MNHYSAITVFDGGVRSAFFNATSTAGILTSHPGHHLTLTGAIIDQILCCGLLMLGILCIVDHRNLNTPKPLIPIALFVLLAGLITAFGLNCGPALNPARDIPARLFAWMIGYGSEVWSPHSHLYWLIGGLIAPHIGGILGTWLYHLGLGLHLDDEQVCKYFDFFIEKKVSVLIEYFSNLFPIRIFFKSFTSTKIEKK